MRPSSRIEIIAPAVAKASVPLLLHIFLLASLAFAQTASPVPQIANPLAPAAVVPGSSGFTLTVNGTGFVSGSTVYWNGSPRTTTYVSAAQLAATINAGDVATPTSGFVTVHSLGARVSNIAFVLVSSPVSAPSFGSSSFGNTDLGFMAVGDFNGDGVLDVASSEGPSLATVLGVGNGSLQIPTLYSIPSTSDPFTPVVGDFNNDGKQDIVTGGYPSQSIDTFLGNGDGTFQPVMQDFIDFSTLQAVSGDFNGDGNLDLAYAANYAVAVLLGNGDGTFRPPIEFPLSNSATAVAVGDFNRDGILDIAAANVSQYGASPAVSILLGRGDGTFDLHTDYPLGENASAVVAADLNGDGYPDLVVVPEYYSYIYVLLNNGDGTFRPAVEYQGIPGSQLNAAAVGDFNSDGKMDIAAANPAECGDTCIQIFSGNGDGTFQPPWSFGIYQYAGTGTAASVGLGDFNRDGRLDIVTPSLYGPYAMIQTASPAPTLVPGGLSFAAQVVGTQSTSQNITLYQPGQTVITINSVTLTGDFQGGGCAGFVLNPGNSQTCSFPVTFAPTADGTRTGSAIINSTGGTEYVFLTGTGTGATLSLTISPTSLTFPAQPLETMSSYQNINITNTGSQTVDFTSISTSGTEAGDFPIVNLCGSTLAAGANCIVEVAFRPTLTGARAASLSIADNATGSPQTVPLAGTGSALHVSNEVLQFGDLAAGSSSSLVLTLRNLGSRGIAVSQIAFVGADGGYYSQVNDCAGGIAPRGSCAITVTFTPETKGQLNALLSFTTNGTGAESASTVFLRGAGN